MPRISEQAKQRNIERVWLTIKRYAPNGVTESEISSYTEIQRRTLNNYLRDLDEEGKIYKDGLLWLPTDYQETKLLTIDLTPAEAYTLYLGSRLLVKQHDKRNELAEKALLQLADKLVSDAKIGNEIAQAAHELARRPADPSYQSTFEMMVKSYLSRTPVNIHYKPLNAKEGYKTTFCTYLIEPSAIGYATYVIGHCSKWDKVLAYKVERIQNAEPQKGQTYHIDKEFPGLEILRNSWSIVMGEKTTRVVLRFSPDVRERVLETQWHPSQDYEDDKEKSGWLRWRVDVAGTMDLEPWIRGWGSDVEVIEPAKLRQKLVDTTEQLAETYQLRPHLQRQPYQWLYAKTDRRSRDRIHLLLYHLIDVGTVAHQMWQTVFTDSFRQQIAGILDITPIEAGQFVAFVAALHDLGKASPAYQNKYAPPWLRDKFKEIEILIDNAHYNVTTQGIPHATVTTWALPALLAEYEGYDHKFAEKMSVALGGHHGNWPGPYATEGINDDVCPLWDEMRRDLYWDLRAVFPPPQITAKLSPHDLNTLLTLFSGLVSVADWVGSNADYFALESKVVKTREYAVKAADAAQRALYKLGWHGWQPSETARDFSQAYAYLNFDKPRPVQQEIIDAAINAPTPTLLIIEAPTGIGKTEIAQYLTDVWLQKHNGRGFYIAMPTQATSNQMHDRTKQFLAYNYPNDLLNIPLVHGGAMFDEGQAEIQLNEVGDDKESGVVAMSWFVKKSKQTLLAPFGVGTVDQTLLSVLQTKHFFVRLIGLSHKVVIFDEIHAYDTYMSTLFERLLRWLNAIGTSVIMLSATLPTATRQKFVKAYNAQELQPDPSNPLPYPAMTIAHANQPPKTIQLTKPKDITLHLNWLDNHSPQTIFEFLQSELTDGGCAAVICNTVKRAQEVFALLEAARQQGAIDIKQENLMLFHARFPFAWRKPIEDAVLAKFGKPDAEKGDRRPAPHEKAIVVATQVVEQSLDLDFDVMVTDLAPIDLMLQRAGRLHRHELRNLNRHHRRQLTIVPPVLEDRLPNFGVDELIYERYLLLQTYHQLHERQELTIPTETAILIESVYTDNIHDEQNQWQKALEIAYQQMKSDQRIQGNKAKRPLIKPPDDYRLLSQTILGLEEDDPTVHQTFQAKTRDIAPGVTLVCLFQAENGVHLEPENKAPSFDHCAPLTSDIARDLWKNSITVQNWTLINYFGPQEKSVPSSWREHPVLRYTRPVIFDADGLYHFDHDNKSYELNLSRTLGLQLINLSEAKEAA